MNTKLIATLGLAATAAFAGLNAQTVVTSDVTTDTTWSGTIILDDAICVTGGAELTILPGTIVRGQPRTAAGLAGAPGSLVVTNTGTIIASGTSTSPIIFTTAAVDNDGNGVPDDANSNGFLDAWTPGDAFYDADPLNSPLGPVASADIPGASGNNLAANVELWGGLIILGNAPTNLGTSGNSTALVGNIEGLPVSSKTEYGGTVCNDNSGTLRFVSVRHGGEVLGSANEINGITLGGVGFGTTIEFCEVYLNWDDGFEWFGGTVNGSNLAVFFAGDDHFDGDQGFSGQLQFLFAVAPYFAVGSSGGDEACEFDGDDSDVNLDGNGDPCPLACYSIANYTFVGPTGATGYVGATVGNEANGRITLRNDYSGTLCNGFVVNTADQSSLAVPTPAGPVFSISTPYPVIIDTLTTDDALVIPAFGANVVTSNIENNNGFGLIGEDQAIVGGLNPRPDAGSGFPPATGLAGKSDAENGAQFVDAPFTGAFANTAPVLWTTGWTACNALGVLVD